MNGCLTTTSPPSSSQASQNPFGVRGEGVERVRCTGDLVHAEALLAGSPCGEVVVQEFCAGFARGDVRISMIRSARGGHEVIAWYRRVPAAGAWKCNLSSGGRLQRCELDEAAIDLAHKVAAIAGLDYLGIDIGVDDGRTLVIETNHGIAGLIDFDVDRNARSMAAVGRFVIDLARHGRRPP